MGVEVERRTSRADVSDPATRIKRLHTDALNTGVLTGALRVPDAIGDLQLELMLQGKVVRYSVSFRAPSEGRLKTRLNWLLRELRGEELPSGLRVKVDWDKRRLYSEAKVDALQDDHASLLVSSTGEPIPAESFPRTFTLTWTTALAKGRGRAGGHVLDGIGAGVEHFYRQVIEGLVAYVPRAPRLPRVDAAEEVREPHQPPDLPAEEPLVGATGLAASHDEQPDTPGVGGASTGTGNPLARTESNEELALRSQDQDGD